MNTIFMRGSGLGLCMTLALGAAQAEVAKEAWVARYNGPGSGKDNVQALTVDAARNAYVTGFSDSGGGNYDFATVKYDADGNEVWVARYDGKSQGADWVKALAVDAAANVVVTGSSAGDGTGFDFATLKYDAEGNQLWVRRYDGPAHGDDRVKALVGDAAGNVYVTGDSVGPDGLDESVTIKYGPQGDLLWEARSGSPGGRQSLVALAVDADGNVFLAGTATPEVGNTDFVIIKYDPWGNALWTAYRDWSVHDDARYLALDDVGNAYVAGARVSYAEQPEGKAHEDLVIVKYGLDGEELLEYLLQRRGRQQRRCFGPAAGSTRRHLSRGHQLTFGRRQPGSSRRRLCHCQVRCRRQSALGSPLRGPGGAGRHGAGAGVGRRRKCLRIRRQSRCTRPDTGSDRCQVWKSRR